MKKRAWTFTRRHWLALTAPLWVAGAYVGIAIGFGVVVGLRGAWQDRGHRCRYYDRDWSRR